MLAPLIIYPLIASLLLLAVGWVIDILHASTHDRQSFLNCTGSDWLGPIELRRVTAVPRRVGREMDGLTRAAESAHWTSRTRPVFDRAISSARA
jgi:hypothetical protein